MASRTVLVLVLAMSVLAGCAADPKDRSPWHQYLHEKGLE